MFEFNRFRRRVSIVHSHGELRVRIAAENQRGDYIFILAWFSCAAICLIWTLIRGLSRSGFSSDDWPLFLFGAVAAGVFMVVLWRTIWRAFGVDEIVVHGGILRWTAKAWWFHQELELPVHEISAVKAVTRWWNRQGSHVEFTYGSRRYLVGFGLRLDETSELAQALKHALGVR